MSFENLNESNKEEDIKSEDGQEKIDADIEKEQKNMEVSIELAKAEFDSIGGVEGIKKACEDLSESRMGNILNKFKGVAEKVKLNALRAGIILAIPTAGGLLAAGITAISGGEVFNSAAGTAGFIAALEGLAVLLEFLGNKAESMLPPAHTGAWDRDETHAGRP